MNQFKVGDRVEVIDASGSASSRVGDRLTISSVTPTSFDSNGKYTMYGFKEKTYQVYGSRLKLIQDDQPFKIGDRVKTVGGTYARGTEFLVTSLHRNSLGAYVGGDEHSYGVYVRDLVLAEPVDNRPKPGDRVRFLPKTFGKYYHNREGILTVSTSVPDKLVLFGMTVYPHEIELVEPTEPVDTLASLRAQDEALHVKIKEAEAKANQLPQKLGSIIKHSSGNSYVRRSNGWVNLSNKLGANVFADAEFGKNWKKYYTVLFGGVDE